MFGCGLGYLSAAAQVDTHHLGEGFWHFEGTRDGTWSYDTYHPGIMFWDLEGLGYEDEMGIPFPQSFGIGHNQRIGVSDMQRGGPKPIDFGWNNHLSHENLFIWVNWGVIFHFLPVHFFFINFVDRRPFETIVKIKPVNFELFNNLNTFVDQQIPRLLLSVV